MNKLNTVYIAGPMEGLTESEMKGWRSDITGILTGGWDISVKDPTRRLPFRGDDDNMNRARMIFRADLMDIDRSQVVLFDFRKGKGYAWGTAMEAMYAFTKGIPLVVWVNPEDPKHPFLEAMATTKVFTMHAAAEAVVALLDAKPRLQGTLLHAALSTQDIKYPEVKFPPIFGAH